MKKRKNKLAEFFTLSWKKTAIVLMIWIGAVFFHNMIYAFIVGVLKIEIIDEPFFFIIAVIIIPAYFIISIIYTLIKKLRRRK
jgi:hypothetical protein